MIYTELCSFWTDWEGFLEFKFICLSSLGKLTNQSSLELVGWDRSIKEKQNVTKCNPQNLSL